MFLCFGFLWLYILCTSYELDDGKFLNFDFSPLPLNGSNPPLTRSIALCAKFLPLGCYFVKEFLQGRKFSIPPFRDL